jgi:hypothetical protein
LNRHAWLFAFVATALVPVACTFPTVTFRGGAGGGGHGSNGGGSSTNPTSAGGTNTTQNTGGVGPGGLGGSGQGNGGATTTTSAGTGGSTPCPSGDECDCDMDHHRKPSCGPGNGDPADDCADYDDRAHPMATTPHGTPITGPVEVGTLPYDFNCDGHETPTYQVLKCTGVGSCSDSQGWVVGSTRPACGDTGDLQSCSGGIGCSYTDIGTTTQSCL